jgi:hypothetical protein
MADLCEELETELAAKTREVEFSNTWLGAVAQELLGDERPTGWEILVVQKIRQLQREFAEAKAEYKGLAMRFDELSAIVGFTKERSEQTGESPLDVAKALKAEAGRLREAIDRAYKCTCENKGKCDWCLSVAARKG